MTNTDLRERAARFKSIEEERKTEALAKERLRLERARYDAALAARDAAAAAQVAASGTLAKHAKAALATMAKLIALREQTGLAQAQARELCPAEVEPDSPADEPDWGERKEIAALAAFLKAGPQQPEAASAALDARFQLDRKNREHSQVQSAVQEMLQFAASSALRKCPEHLHERAWAEFAKRLEERLAADGLTEAGRALIECKLAAARERRSPTDGEIKEAKASERWARVR